MNIYELYIVTSILCGAAAAWIAKEKGRSPLLWFFVGAALNVVIVCAIFFYAARKRPAISR